MTTERLSVTSPTRAVVPERHGAGQLLRSALLIVTAALMTGAIWLGLAELPVPMRLVFITFALAVLGWAATTINDTYIGLVAALVCILAGTTTPERFFTSLGDSTIWLLLASFIVAAAVGQSGLAVRLARRVTLRAQTVGGLCTRLTGTLLLTAFLIPTTSGRAALMLPVFLAVSGAIGNPRVTRALALLFPTVILLSAAATITGAGAHLATAEVLAAMTGERISYGRWLLLGLPFALLSSYSACWAITCLFLTRAERRAPLRVAQADASADAPVSRAELRVGLVAGAMVLLWMSEPLHGLNSTLVALAGALVVTMPLFGVISFKDALKQVEWNLLLFMAATAQLGAALSSSGGAAWLADTLFAPLQQGGPANLLLVLGLVVGGSLLAHLLITSRTARSAVLVPLVIVVGGALGLNPAALGFLATIAAGFCLTLPASAKPLALFSELEGQPFRPRHLLLLSAVLLPIHAALLLVFALFIWPLLGLTLLGPTPMVAVPIWYASALAQSDSLGLELSRWPVALMEASAPLRESVAELLRHVAARVEQGG